MKIGLVAVAIVLSMSVVTNASAQAAKQVKKQIVSQDAKVVYSCPMHSDVKAAKADKCTKCGMALKKVDGAAAVKHAKKHETGGKCEGESIEACKKRCEAGGEEGCAKKCAGQGDSGCAGKQ